MEQTLIPLIAALFFLIVGHCIRVERWKRIARGETVTRSSHLFLSLTFGYSLGLFLPFRLEEILRGLVLKNLGHGSLPSILATIFFERIIDLIVITFVFLIVSFYFNDLINDVWPRLLLVTTVIIISLSLSKGFFPLRWVTFRVSGIFNDRIALFIQELHWSFASLVRDCKPLLKSKGFIISTLLMWGSYLLSTYFLYITMALSQFKVSSFGEVLRLVYGNSANHLSVSKIFSIYPKELTWILLAYFTVPLILILTYLIIFLRKDFSNYRPSAWIARFGTVIPQFTAKTLQVFSNQSDQSRFFNKYFGRNFENAIQLADVLQDTLIIKDLTSGSNAQTWAIMTKSGECIRKLALDRDAAALKKQVDWLNSHNKNIDCTAIIKTKSHQNYFYYDMPYSPLAISFFEIIHSTPIEISKKIILEVTSNLNKYLYQSHVALDTRDLYFEEKVYKNLESIKSSLPDFLCEDTIVINNQNYFGLGFFEKNNFFERLKSKMTILEQGSIHGDLTIENIIIRTNKLESSASGGSWYLIDPNPDNIFNSRFIDMAKIFQSLNKGYELLIKINKVDIGQGEIRFLDAKSLKYQELNAYLVSLVGGEHSEAMCNVRAHEIVNYLRLLPYRFRISKNQSYAIYGTLIILMNEFWHSYEKN